MGRSYFAALAECLKEQIRFFAVYDRGRMAGGMLAIDHGCQRSSLYVAVDDDSMQRYASYALYWTVIADCLRSQVIDRLDLGRSIAASGTYQFKQQWGARDHWVGYASYGKAPAQAAPAGRSALRARLWSSLPLGLCNRLGPRLRRSLPFG
jgi:lipid II:glycine glycyltransferase (peptidoglycan interpeptide bridge formation enzyme)